MEIGKPKKKEIPDDVGDPRLGWADDLAYNQSIDDYNEWLKSIDWEGILNDRSISCKDGRKFKPCPECSKLYTNAIKERLEI